MCPVLDALALAVAAVPGLPSPAGLGAAAVLADQVQALASSLAVLQREVAHRIAALEREAPPPADARGDAVRAGLGEAQATRLRALGRFAEQHPALHAAWAAGGITEDHAAALQRAAHGLPTPELRQQLVELVLPHLPGMDARRARRLIAFTADQLDPADPDSRERSDHAARSLDWTGTGGGISFAGFLPDTAAAAFTAAIDTLVQQLRTPDDGLTPAQRRADALTALVARAAEHGLPAGGGLPAALTLTVSLDEAQRIAARDPNTHGTHWRPRPRSGATIGRDPAGDAAVRFGLCCAAITPALNGDAPPAPPAPPGSLLAKIAAAPAQPLAVGRAVRLATPAQRRALQLRDGGCAIPGCTIPAPYTQPHHVTPWALDGPTDLSNLLSLCFAHHRQVELGHWTITPRTPGQPKPPGAHQHHHWWITPPHP